MKYLVFLDVDGVFTSSRVHMANNNMNYKIWAKFDPVAVDFFNYLHDTYEDVEFVLMSTWRLGMELEAIHHFHWIQSAFINAGFRGKFAKIWRTDESRSFQRALEVKDYLLQVPELKDYLLVDDTDYHWKTYLDKPKWIRTSTEDGILYKHMLQMKSFCGTWDRKVTKINKLTKDQ